MWSMFHSGSSITGEFLFFASYIAYVVCKAKVSNAMDCDGDSALVLLSSFKEYFKSVADRRLPWPTPSGITFLWSPSSTATDDGIGATIHGFTRIVRCQRRGTKRYMFSCWTSEKNIKYKNYYYYCACSAHR